jgi:hypothetical protein
MNATNAMLDRALEPSEAQWQATVIELAQRTNWKVAHFADSRKEVVGPGGARRLVGDALAKGWVDLVLGRDGHVIFAELKAKGGKTTAEQEEWLFILSTIAEAAPDRMTVAVWRPSDWDLVKRALLPRKDAA